MMLQYLLGLGLVLASHKAWAAPEEDLVTDLPGLSFKPNFKQYSGYLQASKTRYLHYWFVESSGNPSKDPLVLWMNGGPGCSSLLGLLTEQGPFRINEDAKTVVENPFAWNQVANMIFLEAPAGVGFSYDTKKNYSSSDTSTAQENYQALKDFFKKFPEYADRDFYITGESYGGVYVPTLTNLVMTDSNIKLKGMAIGNGLLNAKMNDNSLVHFVYYHGLIGNKTWTGIWDACCPKDKPLDCDFSAGKTTQCYRKLAEIQMLVWASGLNVYNLYDECWGGVGKDKTLSWDESHDTFVSNNFGYPFMFLEDTPVARQWKKKQSLAPGKVRETPPCTGDEQLGKYLNTADVKRALHISEQAIDWDMCSDVVDYEKQFYDMTPQFQGVLKNKLRVLVYNGDVDMACNFLGDEWFVDSLNAKNPQERQAWFYQAADGTKQNAGFVKAFDLLTFVTVKGSGHMVPTDKPRPALDMFTNFIQDKPFDYTA